MNNNSPTGSLATGLGSNKERSDWSMFSRRLGEEANACTGSTPSGGLRLYYHSGASAQHEISTTVAIDSTCTQNLCFSISDLSGTGQLVVQDQNGDTLATSSITANSEHCISYSNTQADSLRFSYRLTTGSTMTLKRFELVEQCEEVLLVANVLNSQDYYPFGMVMPGRSFQGSDGYRYGFQGQEQDDEIKGDGNTVNYKYRMLDPRLGRFFSRDPLEAKYPQWTPYQFSGNQVIASRELEGLEPDLDLNATANLTFSFGVPGTSHVKFGAGASLMLNYTNGDFSSQASINLSANYATGGLTTPYGGYTGLTGGFGELILSPGIGIGSGTSLSTSVNYLHGDATTALTTTIQNGLNYNLNFHFANSDGRNQRTATYGIRLGQFSMNVLEDHQAWFGADKEDRWWTGSGNASFTFFNGTSITFGTDTYTGNSDNSSLDHKVLGDTEVGGTVLFGPNKGNVFYWANQNKIDLQMGTPLGFNQSLNNAQTFLQVSTSSGTMIRAASVGPFNFWSQNIIHDLLNPNFHHFKPSVNKNSWQFTGSLGIR